MNEVQLIRAQLALERSHARQVAAACGQALTHAAGETLVSGSALEEFRQACVDYLVCILAWYEERDRRLGQLANALASDDPRHAGIHAILGHPGSSREALERLEPAFAATTASTCLKGWQVFMQFLEGPWWARRDALEGLLAEDSRATDWRTLSGIDADSILEERARHARVLALAPPGTLMAVTGA